MLGVRTQLLSADHKFWLCCSMKCLECFFPGVSQHHSKSILRLRPSRAKALPDTDPRLKYLDTRPCEKNPRLRTGPAPHRRYQQISHEGRSPNYGKRFVRVNVSEDDVSCLGSLSHVRSSASTQQIPRIFVKKTNGALTNVFNLTFSTNVPKYAQMV